MGVIQDTCLNDTHKGREEFSEVRAEGSRKLNRHGYKDFVKKMNVSSQRPVQPRHER
jgi:hypothetical protein